MNILVTGACGFIGSYVCKSLVNDGHAVFGFDNFSNSTEECKQLSFAACKAVVEASVLDEQSIEKALRDFSIDLVIHLAAKPGVEWSTNYPSDCINVNVVGTENVLDAMRKAFVPNVIFASSSTVYSGLSPYGLSKQFGERLVEMHSKLYRCRSLALRLFSVYGPRMRKDLAMNKLADSTRVDKAVFCVRGYATQMLRDYTYVEDVAQAFCLAAEFLAKLDSEKGFFKTIDICNRKPQSLKTVIDVLESHLGTCLNYVEYGMPADWEPASTCGDLILAEQILGWKPRMEFYDGVGKFAEWWKLAQKNDITMTPIVYKQSILSAAEECRKCINMLKVQIGAGNKTIDGWLNTDIDPHTADVYILDATKKFPFSDCYVDAYFCEHLIEHLDYCQQKSMLNECFRTLKHGGIIRLAFPSLRNLINVYLNQGETQKKWANWHFSKFRNDIVSDFSDAQLPFCIVVNDFLRMWSHKLVPDEQLVTLMLKNAGFTDIVVCEVGQSVHKHLAGIEQHSRHFGKEHADMNNIQSVCIEATKE